MEWRNHRFCRVVGWVAFYCFLCGVVSAAEMPKLKVDPAPIPRKAGSTSYAPIVSNVAPSVVSVYTRKKVSRGILPDPLLRRFFGFDGTREEQALGSGVIVSEDGYILTNSHVVEGANEIRVATPDGTEYTGKLIGIDPPTDVAVIKITGTNLVPATLTDSANVRVGDIVLAVGNPFGVGQTVTSGIVSATERSGLGITEYEDFIQTDASVNPGNSGGPLVDVEGRVVGLNTAIFSQSGGSMGIGFAVPVSLARYVMSQIITQGKVVRGYLGVSVQMLTPELAREFKAPNAHGALVGGVSPNTPASRAGLEEGDIITAIDGKPIENARALRLTISQTKPGTDVKLTVLRSGKETEVTAKVGELPKTAASRSGGSEQRAEPQQSPLDGVELQDLDRSIRRELKVPSQVSGAVVSDVNEDSPAFRAGLRPGDIITDINRKKVSNASDAQSALENARNKSVLLRVWSEGGNHYVVIEQAK